ncbi:MAG: hypothetical protein WCG78_01365 [Candidatus Omnitrophota bacterium]
MSKLHDYIQYIYRGKKEGGLLVDDDRVTVRGEIGRLRQESHFGRTRPAWFTGTAFLSAICILLCGVSLTLFMLLRTELARTNTVLMLLASKSNKIDRSLTGNMRQISEIFLDANRAKEQIAAANARIDDVSLVLNDLIVRTDALALDTRILTEKTGLSIQRVSSLNKGLKQTNEALAARQREISAVTKLIGSLGRRLNSLRIEIAAVRMAAEKKAVEQTAAPAPQPAAPAPR